MTKVPRNDWGFAAKMLVKGIVLGAICCTCFMAQANLQVFWNAMSRPLSGQPWALEEIAAELSCEEEVCRIFEHLGDPSFTIPSVFIMVLCVLVGLWDGMRLTQITTLSEKVKCVSEQAEATNMQLRELSLTDSLTRLANRRHFFIQIDQEVKRAERFSQPLSCMMLDLDFFKNVNDTCGHQFGDYVLQEIAGILKSQCREIDVIARYGGEEFAVVLPNTPVEKAKVLAERLSKEIALYEFSNGGMKTNLTTSIGLASWTPEKPISVQQLLSRADTALYEVKTSGRNAVLTWNRSHRRATGRMPQGYLNEQRMEDLRHRLGGFSRDLKHSYMSAVNSLLGALKVRDNYTQAHSYDVSNLAQAIAAQMGLSEAEIEIIKNASNLHDVGKIGIDEKILCKPDRLSRREMEVMKEHPRMAAEILKPLKFLFKEIALIVHHHERYDGKGYPHGLKGDAIPLGSRIIAVADAFSAMTTERPYRRAMSSGEAIQELIDNSGTQVDPDVVKAFVKAVRSGKINLPEETGRHGPHCAAAN